MTEEGNGGSALSQAVKRIGVAVFGAISAALAMAVTLVSLIFFVPVFIAEGIARLVKGKPPADPDTEEITIPVRKPKIQTIALEKVDAAFPAVEFDSLAHPPNATESVPNTPATTIVQIETPDKAASDESLPPRTITIVPDKTCSVCLGDFQPTDSVRQLTCQHIFHRTCLDKWFTSYHSHCPLCLLDYSDPENPQVREDLMDSQFVMTKVTVSRAKKSEFWLGRWLEGVAGNK